MCKLVTSCRVCGSTNTDDILKLGRQYLTGIFPKIQKQNMTSGPLTLMKCNTCGLVQLRHSYEVSELYGANYGYRSGLNRSMAEHLRGIVGKLQGLCAPGKQEIVVDIGSNDGTLLSFYPPGRATLVGFDPSAEKFRHFYRSDIRLITDFFSAETFRKNYGPQKAKIITAIAMFYDLERPLDFVREIESLLDDEGIWHLEQSYLPLMLKTTAYDTICHEHLEYYSLRQIKWMTDQVGLKIIGLELNDVNGGSFAITLAKTASHFSEATEAVRGTLQDEENVGLNGREIYSRFERRVWQHRENLMELLKKLKAEGKKVWGYGASTKGNVVLQCCGIGPTLLPAIAEVNQEKFGCFTPGTGIPIISEKEAHALSPDYFLVLPWHFKRNILERESEYLNRGGRFIFPLPEIEIVGR
jgi:hypothetical protein